ncbi:hypothetical protein GCM10007301_12610 [Azorhizobium oxalatiphilum]|uniref:Polymerase nucleotidyl transferase domain-containing protein n=1 Tax=Azorhizobium oxalatiphilum TaxID=980631 RepID=A0A917F707_9HYPH|nr:nucleotidyltransferase domain-containing protein [Azorhizobium oxalatiphilum]GGF54555.1 hypothetical protein GCM10007301_12610 [Azorhizobium oxalatiphilum]
MVVHVQNRASNRVPGIDPATRESVRRFLERIGADFPVAKAILYGSRARGDHGQDSDADLAVVLDAPQGRLHPTMRAMAGIAYDVFRETGILLSPLPVWRDQWAHPERHANPSLLDNIRRDGLEI